MVGGSILLHGARYVDGLDEMTEAWFILELTANGAMVKEAFQGIPNLEDFRLFDSSCALVRPYLCVIGGRGHTKDTCDFLSSQIRVLNIGNPTKWDLREKTVPFICARPTVAAVDDSIFVLRPSGEDPITWGWYYNVIGKYDKEISTPPNCVRCDVLPVSLPSEDLHDSPFCLAYTEGTAEFRFVASKFWGHVYRYNMDKDSFTCLCDFELPEERSAVFGPLTAILNGKLYMCFCDNKGTISLYILQGRNGEILLGPLSLPMENLDPQSDSKPFLVAIADYKLCILWTKNRIPTENNQTTLYLAKVDVSEDSPTHSEEKHDLMACSLINCLLFYPEEALEGKNDSYIDLNGEGEKLTSSNIGFRLLQKMGWKGKGLGKDEQVEPIKFRMSCPDRPVIGEDVTNDDTKGKQLDIEKRVRMKQRLAAKREAAFRRD